MMSRKLCIVCFLAVCSCPNCCCFAIGESSNLLFKLQTQDEIHLTNTWSVKLVTDSTTNSTDHLHSKATMIAESLGMSNLGQVGELVGYYVFSSSNVSMPNGLKKHPDIEWHSQQEVLHRDKRNRQALEFSDPWYGEQWHLHNRVGSLDCNVTEVWAHNITGLGVVVAVVDDGVEWRHPDLLNNYCAAGSFDLNSNDDDPTPVADDEDDNKHGTRCAGEISAVVNSVCGIGIAYNSMFSGIRILDGLMTDSLEATAFNKRMDVNHIYSCSWGPQDDGKTIDGPRQLAQSALKHGVVAGRSGFGSIFIAASGNGGESGDNCNYDGYANSIYTVTIAAVDEFGRVPPYAEHCTSMLACTVSSGIGSARSIVTTDWTLGKKHDHALCTRSHTGTSAATPLVAGMVALMLEARPCLTWRDVQHIVVMTARPLNVEHDRTWTRNTAGFKHSNDHGFGLLDAWRLVTAAKVWQQVPWLTSLHPACPDKKLPILHGHTVIVNSTVTERACANVLLNTLENVLVTVTVRHDSRGSLRFIIICPSGTRSVIAPRNKDKSAEGLEWTFSTVKCWGEQPTGKYQLQVTDTRKGNQNFGKQSGLLMSWSLLLYGSQMTSEDIVQRVQLLHEAHSGQLLNTTVNCPVGQPLPFDVTSTLSERTLKLVTLLSFFFLFWALYYPVEAAFCSDELKINPSSASESATDAVLTQTIVYDSVGASCSVTSNDIGMVELPTMGTTDQVLSES